MHDLKGMWVILLFFETNLNNLNHYVHEFNYCLYLCSEKFKTMLIMARPIKETPVLTGEDAKRFRWHMDHPSPVSPEEKERARKAYEMFKRNSPDCPLFR